MFTRIVDDHRDNGILDKLSYADYGVTKYTDMDIDFSRMKHGILPKAKYTTHSEYVVLKGQKDRRTGEWVVSAKDLARIICDSNYYFGSEYSYGDAEIYKRAYDEKIGGGNNTNWVTFNANHHMAVLQNQIASLF